MKKFLGLGELRKSVAPTDSERIDFTESHIHQLFRFVFLL